MNDMAALLVITTLPDEIAAVKLVATLLSSKLVACVHTLPAGISNYRWQGKVEQAREHTLLIKTTVARYAELEATIKQHHPYDVPELIAFPIAHGLDAYLKWIEDETK
jgi:periplasmic divalent cation tolerance protein